MDIGKIAELDAFLVLDAIRSNTERVQLSAELRLSDARPHAAGPAVPKTPADTEAPGRRRASL